MVCLDAQTVSTGNKKVHSIPGETERKISTTNTPSKQPRAVPIFSCIDVGLRLIPLTMKRVHPRQLIIR
jgi:hypothetical protein